MDWLNENDEHSMDILRNAYNRDKADNFPQTSEHTKFSNSVVDVFTQLNEALKVLKQVTFFKFKFKNYICFFNRWIVLIQKFM